MMVVPNRALSSVNLPSFKDNLRLYVLCPEFQVKEESKRGCINEPERSSMLPAGGYGT